jgi:hypothetical protein
MVYSWIRINSAMPNTSRAIVGVITLYLTVSVSNGLTVPDTPWKFDMFRHLSCRDELVRVDNYSSQLAKLKDVLAVVVMYAGRDDTMRGEVAAHLLRLRDRLVKNKSIDATSIVLIDGGFREEQEIELFITPNLGRGSVHYLAVPTLKPEEGRFKKSVFTRDVYPCSKANEFAAPSNKRLKQSRGD